MTRAVVCVPLGSLSACESVIERGIGTFIDVGRALAEIKSNKEWYRERFGTFETYCRERWGFSQQHAGRLMKSAETAANLKSEPIGSLPATESQARPLTRLPAQEQPGAWREAVETAPNGRVTAKHVESVVSSRVTTNGRRFPDRQGIVKRWESAVTALETAGDAAMSLTLEGLDPDKIEGLCARLRECRTVLSRAIRRMEV